MPHQPQHDSDTCQSHYPYPETREQSTYIYDREKYEVPDVMNDGFAHICETTDLCTIPEEEVGIRDTTAMEGDIGAS